MTYWLSNQIQTPDGTTLRCWHNHDYCSHVDSTTGETYINDGIGFYVRRSINQVPAVDLSVTTDDSFEEQRLVDFWGTYGRNQDFVDKVYIYIAQMQTCHIEAIIRTQTQIAEAIKDLFNAELRYRKDEQKKGTWIEPPGLDETAIPKLIKIIN